MISSTPALDLYGAFFTATLGDTLSAVLFTAKLLSGVTLQNHCGKTYMQSHCVATSDRVPLFPINIRHSEAASSDFIKSTMPRCLLCD